MAEPEVNQVCMAFAKASAADAAEFDEERSTRSSCGGGVPTKAGNIVGTRATANAENPADKTAVLLDASGPGSAAKLLSKPLESTSFARVVTTGGVIVAA